MNVKKLIRELQNIREDLQDKEIFVIAENGLCVPPEIKFRLKNYSKLDKSKENVNYILLVG